MAAIVNRPSHRKAPTEREVRTLMELGGAVQFLTQRCVYLMQNPDGAIGKGVLMDDRAYADAGLLGGALVELFSQLRHEPRSDWNNVVRIDVTPGGMVVRGALVSDEVRPSFGSDLIRYISRRWETEKAADGTTELVFEIETSDLIEAWKAMPSLSGCIPVRGPPPEE